MFLYLFATADIYVLMVSSTHNVAAKGWYIALVATTVETNNPEAELKPGLDLLGPITEKFISIDDQMAPLDSGEDNKVSKCSCVVVMFFADQGSKDSC